ncbi:hypothetical protein RND81_03G168100 [Saponaria officinalis]|uniref:Legume lectin domain-containing protein n=1 Tax=Saponaria officinalis TaxID=3572 RepID=A0AAW1M0U3_SAPOF
MNQFQGYNLFFSFIIFNFMNSIIAEQFPSFSLQSFDKNPDFYSQFALLGDAQITNEGNFVNLTSPSFGLSFGQIICKKPFKFLDSKSSKVSSFSSKFTFSISPGVGDGIMFVIFPKISEISRVFDQGYFGLSNNVENNFVSVEYDTRKDDNFGDLNDNHVGVDLGSMISNEISDVSSIGLLLNSGVLLKTWINYDGISNMLKIRLAKSGDNKPYNPLISYRVDLSRIWGDMDVLVGISSSSGESSQISSLSSWSFEISEVSSALYTKSSLNGEMKFDGVRPVRRKKSCFLTVLGTVIFATGCGTLVAFLALFAWVVFFGRHSNVVPELCMNHVDFKYEKVDVTIDHDFTKSSTR